MEKITQKTRGKKKSVGLASNKYLVFKGRPGDAKVSTYIDEYRGELVVGKTEMDLHNILTRTKTGRAVHLSKTAVIDARNPTDCYAQYANDTRRKPGLHYNAKLIAHPQTKTAAIIAILDIYVDDEIYVDYGFSYWSQKPTVSEDEDEED